MNLPVPFRFLLPTFFSGLLDDPVLLLRIRPMGRSLLFDCGQVHHLAKRVLKSVEALFITHAHMDHFMGIDTFIRNVHVSPRTFDLFGPPGLAGKLAHKLAGYDWNLTEANWCTYRVHEIHPGRELSFLLPGPEGFPCRREKDSARKGREIYRNGWLKVEAELCDHKIPTLMFRITERPAFLIDEKRLEEMGLVAGDWLRELKRLFFEGRLEGSGIRVLKRRGELVQEERIGDAARLYRDARRRQKPASIGYVTDIGFTPENLEKVTEMMAGVDWLICECTFLAADVDKARRSYHLCTSDMNQLLKRLRPPFVLPMHLSKSYLHRSGELYRELEVPPGTTLLRLPVHLVPRPLLPSEVPDPEQFPKEPVEK